MITQIKTVSCLLLGVHVLPCFPSVTAFTSFIPEKILSSFHSIGCNKPVAVSCIHSQWRRNGISAHLQKMIPHPGHTSLPGPEHLPPVVHRALHRHLLCSGNHLWSQSEDLLSNYNRGGSLQVQKAKQRSAFSCYWSRVGLSMIHPFSLGSWPYHTGWTQVRLVKPWVKWKYSTGWPTVNHLTCACSSSAQLLTWSQTACRTLCNVSQIVMSAQRNIMLYTL